MRHALLMIVASAGLVALATRVEACSIRGQYCGYPSWAANAFEGRFGFKGNPKILTDYYDGDRQVPRKKLPGVRKLR